MQNTEHRNSSAKPKLKQQKSRIRQGDQQIWKLFYAAGFSIKAVTMPIISESVLIRHKEL